MAIALSRSGVTARLGWLGVAAAGVGWLRVAAAGVRWLRVTAGVGWGLVAVASLLVFVVTTDFDILLVISFEFEGSLELELTALLLDLTEILSLATDLSLESVFVVTLEFEL